MANTEFDVDEKILHMLGGDCDPSDKALLDEWIRSSVEREHYFRERMREFRKIKLISGILKAEEMKQRVSIKLKKIERRRNMLRYLYISAVAVSILVFVEIWMLQYKTTNRLPRQETIVSVKPGMPKAYLKLEGGEVVDLLTQAKNAYIPELSATLNVDSNMLKYHEDSLISAFHELIVPRGGEYSLELSDGTKVHVNAGSKLLYPVNFNKNQREVFLSGEAYFEVKHMEEVPFVVHAGETDIQVLGTSFNVNAYVENFCDVITLEEGCVQIATKGGGIRRIVPGQQYSYDKKTQQVDVENVDTELFTSWRNGYYYFNRMPLETILNTLSLWYNVDVEYEDTTLKYVCFSGKLKRFENIQHLLEKFERTENVGFVLKGEKIIVKKYRE